MKKSNLQEERKLLKEGYKRIVGLDEVGRGCLAGPVVACAVLVSNLESLSKLKLKDSKQLSPKSRAEFYKILTSCQSVKWGIGKVYPKTIDRINILEATKLAMKRAVKNLKVRSKKRKIDLLILDGNFKLNLPIPQKSIVKADEKVFSCSVASIIAKVTRDRIMERLHKKYSQYGFDRHKGYGTRYHLKMLKKFGRCAIHRHSFKL